MLVRLESQGETRDARSTKSARPSLDRHRRHGIDVARPANRVALGWTRRRRRKGHPLGAADELGDCIDEVLAVVDDEGVTRFVANAPTIDVGDAMPAALTTSSACAKVVSISDESAQRRKRDPETPSGNLSDASAAA